MSVNVDKIVARSGKPDRVVIYFSEPVVQGTGEAGDALLASNYEIFDDLGREIIVTSVKTGGPRAVILKLGSFQDLDRSYSIMVNYVEGEDGTIIPGNQQELTLGAGIEIELELGQPSVSDAPQPPLTDLRLWLKADAGLSYADGQEILLWEDQSALGNDVSTTGGNGPLFETSGINGLPTVDFGTSQSKKLDRLVNNLFAGAGSARTFYVVGLCPSGGSYSPGSLIQERQNAFQFVAQVGFNGNFIYTDAVAVNTTLTTTLVGRVETPYQACLQSPGAGGKISFWFNEALEAKSGDPNVAVETGTTGFSLGLRNGVGQGWIGFMSEVLVYEAAHDATARQQVFDYLSARYGI